MNFNSKANKCGRTCHTYHQKEFCEEPEEYMSGCVCKNGKVSIAAGSWFACYEQQSPLDSSNRGSFSPSSSPTHAL